jgi:hypothetical protein
MRKHLLIAFVVLIPFITKAQQHTWKPWAVAEAGLLAGSYGPSGDLRVQGGMQKGAWKFGVGAAHDGYKFETLPVYAQARKMFGKKHMKPFVLASLGANFEMVKEPAQDILFIDRLSSIWRAPDYSYSTGMYGELGAGLAFRTQKTFGFNISFSYTRKTLTESYAWTSYNGVGPGESNMDESKYLMNRWAFRLAISY